jgi:putative ABC transport system ATP-binding protein
MQPGDVIVKADGLTKQVATPDHLLVIVKNAAFEVRSGEAVAILGASGSGKSTLLGLLAGLDVPSSGRVLIGGEDLFALDEDGRARLRGQLVGFVFQSFQLLPALTALENVMLPLVLTKLPAAERKKRAEIALRVVGLDDRMHHRPAQLSGGQEQRVGIARAIVHDPQIIVADEPTGELDRGSADDVLSLLERLNDEFDKTILMVTHDPAAAERAHVQRRLDKGKLL